MSKAFAPGVRGMSIASILAILIGVLHTLGLANEPPNENWAAAQDAMRNATIEAGSLSMSLAGVFEAVWIQTGILLVIVGLANIVAVTAVPGEVAVPLARRLSILHAISAVLMAALIARYMIPPPFVAFVVLTIAFGFAAYFARGSRES